MHTLIDNKHVITILDNKVVSKRICCELLPNEIEISSDLYNFIQELPAECVFDSNGNLISVLQDSQPTELEILGQEVTSLKLSNIQKDMTINMLGQELTNIKIKLIQGGM